MAFRDILIYKKKDRFDDIIASEIEKINGATGSVQEREAKLDFLVWFGRWIDKSFACSTKLCFRRWCEHGHEHERTEWTILNVLCQANDQSIETSLRRFFSQTVLSEQTDGYENKPCHAPCPECLLVKSVVKRQKVLAEVLPEIFVFQLRDTGVYFTFL
jgi:hypothetical protein